jgi:hypothetical protein
VTEIETDLAKAAQASSAELEQLRRRIDRAQPKAELAGKAVIDRLAAARRAAAGAWVARLVEGARAMAARQQDPDASILEIYRKAEDELTEQIDREKDAASRAGLETQLQQVVAESDALCARAFGATAIAATPPRDLLAQGAKTWNASEVRGFVHRVQDGALVIVGPDADAKSRAVMSTGDAERWRDVVLDMQVERAKGTMILCFRLGKEVDADVPAMILDVATCPENERVHLTASVIGGKLTLRKEGLPEPVIEQDLPWNMRRTGALGLVIPPGAELRFTKLDVRVLR